MILLMILVGWLLIVIFPGVISDIYPRKYLFINLFKRVNHVTHSNALM